MKEPALTLPNATPSMTASSSVTQSRLSYELAMIFALWHRDFLHLIRERSRWLGLIIQPLLFWVVLGSGMKDHFDLSRTLGSSVEYTTFLFPGIVIMIVLFVSIFASISIIEDRQTGFLQTVMIAPGSRAAMVLGKILGVMTLVFAECAIFLLLAPWAGFSLTGIHWPLVVLSITLSTIGLTAINIVMAWLSSSTQAYHALMSIILMPLWIISGAIFPTEKGWLAYVALINPLSYSVSALRLSMQPSRTPLEFSTLITALVGLLAFSIISVTVTVIVCRRK